MKMNEKINYQFPTWFDTAIEKLKQAAALQHNWDSYGALKTNPLSLHHAYEFLDCICKIVGISEPLIAVNASGNICFEFQQASTMEIEVLPSCKAIYCLVDQYNVEEEGESQSPFKDIVDRLGKHFCMNFIQNKK